MKNFRTQLQNGYSLVEMVIYIALLSIIFAIVVSTVLSFTKTYRDLTVLRILDHSSVDAMERMTRDVRDAGSVDTSHSTLGSSPGVLTIVATSGSLSTTTKFYLDNGIVKVDVNGVYEGPLTLSNASTTSLIFTKLTSSVSSAVKIDMTVQAVNGTLVRTKSYHSTIILKGQ